MPLVMVRVYIEKLSKKMPAISKFQMLADMHPQYDQPGGGTRRQHPGQPSPKNKTLVEE